MSDTRQPSQSEQVCHLCGEPASFRVLLMKETGESERAGVCLWHWEHLEDDQDGES